MLHHWAFFLSNNSNKVSLIQQLLRGKVSNVLPVENELEGAVFSPISLQSFLEEEERHEQSGITQQTHRSTRSLSSGEQKKALLNFILSQQPAFIILDNPFDNLDVASQASLKSTLQDVAKHTSIIQLINRKTDVLPFITHAASMDERNHIIYHHDLNTYLAIHRDEPVFVGKVPPPIREYNLLGKELVRFHNVSVNYDERPILNNINWTLNAGEFWQLRGPNGSGKTTMLTMIAGDNPKAYGQDLMLFGRKKGTGETVWEIKDKIGYLTPSMTDLFSTQHTVLQMILSGFYDSVGLYNKPSEWQEKLALEWLQLMEMLHLRKAVFRNISLGQQRMVLIARAMVKHPPLLILDEPIAGLDDHNASLVIALINKVAAESTTAILYVSHRSEAGLMPQFTYELTPTENGSVGKVL